MRVLKVLALATGFSACGQLEESKDGRPSYDGLKAEIRTNHEQWSAAPPKDYSYKTDVTCFCPMTKYLITVQAGQVAKVEQFVYDAEGRESKKEVSPDSDDGIRTIDEMFALAEEWADRQPDGLEVEFDPTYHYPSRLAIDHRESYADDEMQVRVFDFAVP